MSGADTVMHLTAEPIGRGAWFRDVRDHGAVTQVLARKDFQTRYKRASLGVLWAVGLPILQAVVVAIVFSRVIRFDTGSSYAAFVLSGMLPWTYFTTTLPSTSTGIVSGAGLTDKVWFPRVVLVIVPAIANIPGLVISITFLVIALPVLDVGIGPEILLLLPAVALLVAFTVSLSMVLAALHVYFRDVRYIVQAALLAWLYVTPVLYPKRLVGSLETLIDLNPMTGVITVFRLATVGASSWQRPVVVSLVTLAVLAVVGLELQRRHDRRFVDQL